MLTYKADYPNDGEWDTLTDEDVIGKPVTAGPAAGNQQVGEVTGIERTETRITLTIELEDTPLARAMAGNVGWTQAGTVHPAQENLDV